MCTQDAQSLIEDTREGFFNPHPLFLPNGPQEVRAWGGRFCGHGVHFKHPLSPPPVPFLVHSANEEEVAEFMDVVLTEGDIAILDQHLEYGGDTNLLGTDIVAKLLQGGFQGLICMRSGNTADDDVSKYRTAGAHCVFGKDIPMKQMIARMKEAYHTHCVERHSTASIRVEDIASSSCSPAMMCACGHSV